MATSLGVKKKKKRKVDEGKASLNSKKRFIKQNLTLSLWKVIREKVLPEDKLFDCPALKFKVHESACIARIFVEEHICDKKCSRCVSFDKYVDLICTELKNNGF